MSSTSPPSSASTTSPVPESTNTTFDPSVAPISGGDDGEVELTLAGPVRMWELKDEVQIFGDPNVAKAPSGDGGEATVPEPDTTTDVNGSVTTTTDEDGTVVTTTYDEVGRVYSTETIDPETGVKVTMVYDESGDVVETQMTWPDGETRTWDGEGNETTPPADDTEDTDDTDDVDDPDDTGDTGEGDDEGYTTDDGGVTISAHGTELLNSLNVDRVSQIPLDPAGPDYEEGGGQTVVSSDPVRVGLDRPLTKPVGDPIESDAQVLPSELSPTRFDATGPDVVPLDDAPEPIVITPTGGNPIAMDAGFAIAEPHAGASLLAVDSASPEGTPSLHEGLDGPEPDGGFMPPDDLD